MKRIFKLLFKDVARQLTADALNVGVMRGVTIGRQIERAELLKQGVIIESNLKRDIETILQKAGF